MKNMEFLIDVNVILDYFEDRTPFADDAEELLRCCDRRKIKGYLSVTEITTLYYLLHKYFHDKNKVYDVLDTLLNKLGVLPVIGSDIYDSIEKRPKDFEDCVIASSCKWGEMDAIVTRNKKDFIEYDTPVYTPKEMLKIINEN